MTDPVKEQLSACLDGELPPGELDLLLKQVQKDSATSSALGRYALIGETLRSGRTIAAPTDFAAKVRAAIDAEQPHATPAPSPAQNATRSHPWLRPVAGLAVAAGVAALAILAIRPEPQQAPQAQYAAETSQVTLPEDPEAASYIVPASPPATGYVPATRLTNYVVAHSEYSTPLGRRSVLSGVLAEDDPDADADDATTEVSDNEPTPQQ